MRVQQRVWDRLTSRGIGWRAGNFTRYQADHSFDAARRRGSGASDQDPVTAFPAAHATHLVRELLTAEKRIPRGAHRAGRSGALQGSAGWESTDFAILVDRFCWCGATFTGMGLDISHHCLSQIIRKWLPHRLAPTFRRRIGGNQELPQATPFRPARALGGTSVPPAAHLA